MTEQDAFAPTHADYTPDELLEQAQGNARAAILATVAFLRETDVPLDAWATAIGQRFASAWGDPEPWDAHEFLDAMLANLRSLGAEVVTADLDTPERASATISGIFDNDECERFGTTRTDALVFLEATGVIAEERGITWSWDDDGDMVTLTTTRTG